MNQYATEWRERVPQGLKPHSFVCPEGQALRLGFPRAKDDSGQGCGRGEGDGSAVDSICVEMVKTMAKAI